MGSGVREVSGGCGREGYGIGESGGVDVED